MTSTLENDISTLLRYAMMATGEGEPEQRAELDACGDRLRAALADLPHLEDLAQHTLRWRDYDEANDPHSPGFSTAPIVGFLMAVQRYRARPTGGEFP